MLLIPIVTLTHGYEYHFDETIQPYKTKRLHTDRTRIGAFTTQAYLFQKAFEREEARADKTIQEIIQIREAMRAWRLDQGDWADVANNCVDAITTLTNATPTAYLRNIDVLSPYGTDYVTNCDANTFSIEVKASEDNKSNEDHYDAAKYISTKLAGTIIKLPPDDDTTITSIPRNTINPHSLDLADLLPLAGTTNRQMTGDIDMGGNGVWNAKEVKINVPGGSRNIKLGFQEYTLHGTSFSFGINFSIDNKTGDPYHMINCDCSNGIIYLKSEISIWKPRLFITQLKTKNPAIGWKVLTPKNDAITPNKNNCNIGKPSSGCWKLETENVESFTATVLFLRDGLY